MDNGRHLYILWTNGDPETSENMVMMYATNSLLHRWWDQVTVIIWGQSQITALENERVKLKIEVAQKAGVKFTACKACAINLKTIDGLKEAGVEVIYWGDKLSGLIQEGAHILSV